MPVRVIITEGTCADIRQACPLVEGIKPEMVIADKAYSVDSFRKHLDGEKIQAVIPAIRRGNRSQITYDENGFLNLKCSSSDLI